MSKPFTDEEMMVLAQLSYKDPYIKAKGHNLSLYNMLESEESYLIECFGEGGKDIIKRLKEKVYGKDYYVVASTNDKHNTGFSALAIEGPDSKTVTVAVRGTEKIGIDNENSSRDTYADAQLGFEAETNQQRKMDEFMKQFESYDSIYLTGHSLGGNLAISGAIGFKYPKKIKGVVTFNCPGQNPLYIAKNCLKIAILRDKFINYQNENDMVSDINYPIGKVIVIKSNGNEDNHNLIGADISSGKLEMVDGNKKSIVHTLIFGFVNGLEIVLNPFKPCIYAFFKACIFINITVEKIEKLNKWVKNQINPGCRYASANPQITVNTYHLRTYAQRLQSVNRRITNLDSRLDSLYWKVGLLDLWNLMQADILTGYSWRLSRCASYLNDTATDFENVESAISNSL